MDGFETLSVPVIAAICYGAVEILKLAFGSDNKIKNAYPLISAALGAVIGLLLFTFEPELVISKSLLGACITGIFSGLSATGGNQIAKRIKCITKNDFTVGSDDEKMKFYITGDKHRHFNNLIRFCRLNKTQKNDVIIILGDAGINYFGDRRDKELKKRLSKVNITLFCIHGNKENRPENIKSYGLKNFCGGLVYYEPEYSNLLFAKDGEIYNFGGHEYMVIGGAHSVDKLRCITEGQPYWEDEMPSSEIKKTVRKKLHEKNWKIYGLLTHTCPRSYMPSEVFISSKKFEEEYDACSALETEYKLDIDRSTEDFFDEIHKRLDYKVWYCGHFHTSKEICKIVMLHKEIRPLCNREDLKDE